MPDSLRSRDRLAEAERTSSITGWRNDERHGERLTYQQKVALDLAALVESQAQELAEARKELDEWKTMAGLNHADLAAVSLERDRLAERFAHYEERYGTD